MDDETASLDNAMLESLESLLGEKFLLLVTSYLSDCKDRLGRIRSALDPLDLVVIKNEAHGIKGSSRNLGANPLADVCSEVEAQARQGDDTDLEQKVSAIEQLFAAVAVELEARLR